jgi:hypothetical protein
VAGKLPHLYTFAVYEKRQKEKDKSKREGTVAKGRAPPLAGMKKDKSKREGERGSLPCGQDKRRKVFNLPEFRRDMSDRADFRKEANFKDYAAREFIATKVFWYSWALQKYKKNHAKSTTKIFCV